MSLFLLAWRFVCTSCASATCEEPNLDRTSLPIREPERPKYIELDVRGSTPPSRFEVKAPRGAPNIAIVLLDDVGYGATDVFGGPVPMPTMKRLAANGLKYNRFHVTALCAPTRTALLTGYNHHSNNMGSITETATSFPGMTSLRPQSITPLAEVLRNNGFNTGYFGKNHEVPPFSLSTVGPQDQWPTRSGWEKFYGFLGAETNQYAPTIYDGITIVEPKKGPDYHFTTDMTNEAVTWLHAQSSLAPEKPFFLYYSTGATHAPHHAPRDWINKFSGQFDIGWDKVREHTLARQIQLGVVPEGTVLAPKPEFIPDWSSLSSDEKRLFARQMEVYAAFAAHTDHEVGRLLTALEDTGKLDDTFLIYIAGDNGASAEGHRNGMFNEYSFFNGVPEKIEGMLAHLDDWGGPKTYPHYSAGWAVALNSPFAYTKQVASDFGGIRNGMVAHWPARITTKGEVRSQFTHVIDVAPTVYEITGVPPPQAVDGIKQGPVEGTSFAYSFDAKDEPERHNVQYFEMLGNRAIYQDGWFARTIHRAAWEAIPRHPLQEDVWDLFDERTDFSLAHNVADQHPDRLEAMQALFMSEASAHHALPIDDRALERMNAAAVGRPTLMAGRNRMVLYTGMTSMAIDVFIDLRNKAYTITAIVDVKAGDHGVLVCQGGRFGGLSFYLDKDGKPAFTYNYLGLDQTTLAASKSLTPGKHSLVYNFAYNSPGKGKGGLGRISVDSEQVASGFLKRTQPAIFSIEDHADVGVDLGTPVVEYGIPSRFTGRILNITIDAAQ